MDNQAEIIPEDGRLIRVRPCTERHGLWLELIRAPQGGGEEAPIRAVEKLLLKAAGVEVDDNNVVNWFWLPGDCLREICDAILSVKMFVERDEE